MRICLVYDCLYPYTVGGAERWYGNLARGLAVAGHDVTYLTRRQWPDHEPPAVPGVRVIAVSSGGTLYADDGRRTIGPPLRFAGGIFGHLVRHRGDYDVVHLCAFPYFSLISARLSLLRSQATLVVDWFEVWSADYWRTYLGPLRGLIGHLVQRLCVRLTPTAFVFSRLHRDRLLDEGLSSAPTVLGGLYRGRTRAPAPRPTRPLVVFAGRHIPEKRVALLVEAMGLVRSRHRDARCVIFGDGPERPRVLALIAALGLEDVVSAPGFAEDRALDDELRSAACLALPSSREGYGLIVIEAAAAGTPSVVVRGADNAAVELIEAGVNGLICEQATPEALAHAIGLALESAEQLRASTARWFDHHAERFSVQRSLEQVLEIYNARTDPASLTARR